MITNHIHSTFHVTLPGHSHTQILYRVGNIGLSVVFFGNHRRTFAEAAPVRFSKEYAPYEYQIWRGTPFTDEYNTVIYLSNEDELDDFVERFFSFCFKAQSPDLIEKGKTNA